MHGFVEHVHFDCLRVSGPAAERFLDRMLSNTIGDLPENQARGVFLLEPTGRIVSGGLALRDGAAFVIACVAGWGNKLKLGLEKYRVADPVDFSIEETIGGLWLGGDAVPEGVEVWPDAPLGVVRSGEVTLIRTDWAAGDCVIWLGALPADAATVPEPEFTRARIEAGTPWVDAELTEKTIPLEAGLYSWLSHTKGCYVGQEVVERMWSRDRAARRLVRFRGGGIGVAHMRPVPVRGDAGKGVITSIASVEDGLVGLGYYTGDVAGTVADEIGGTWTMQALEPR